MLIETKFSIGDVVYYATTTTETKEHECPDCLGTRKWKAGEVCEETCRIVVEAIQQGKAPKKGDYDPEW